jgi:hypothetical protein
MKAACSTREREAAVWSNLFDRRMASRREEMVLSRKHTFSMADMGNNQQEV